MRAIDTNIVVRFLTANDAGQHALAVRLILREEVFVPTTVLLETEWVLRSLGLDPKSIIGRLRDFGGLETVTFEDRAGTARAFGMVEAGADFADALHLSRAAACDDLVTFDRAFARLAGTLDETPVTLLTETG